MIKKYKIRNFAWLVKDQEDIKFHLDEGDYFGTLATILNLVKDKLKQDGLKDVSKIEEILHDLKKDLLHLQQNYQIIPKTKNKNKIPNGKEINQ